MPDPEEPELPDPEEPDPEEPDPERPEPPAEVGVEPPPGPELVDPRPRFPLRAVVAVLPGVVPPGPSTVVAVVLPVVGVLTEVEVASIVTVVASDVSGPWVELVLSPPTSASDELVVLLPAPPSDDDVAARALPAVSRPATARAARAGVKVGRGI